MSIEQRRKDALEDLRAMLAEGMSADIAIKEVADAYSLGYGVVSNIAEPMLQKIDQIKASAAADRIRGQRQVAVDSAFRSYSDLVSQDHRADPFKFLKEHQIAGLSSDEDTTLFFRCVDAWLRAQARVGN
jgi:hypothetical protein